MYFPASPTRKPEFEPFECIPLPHTWGCENRGRFQSPTWEAFHPQVNSEALAVQRHPGTGARQAAESTAAAGARSRRNHSLTHLTCTSCFAGGSAVKQPFCGPGPGASRLPPLQARPAAAEGAAPGTGSGLELRVLASVCQTAGRCSVSDEQAQPRQGSRHCPARGVCPSVPDELGSRCAWPAEACWCGPRAQCRGCHTAGTEESCHRRFVTGLSTATF